MSPITFEQLRDAVAGGEEVHPEAAGGGTGDRAPEFGRADGKELAEGDGGPSDERDAGVRGPQPETDPEETGEDSSRWDSKADGTFVY